MPVSQSSPVEYCPMNVVVTRSESPGLPGSGTQVLSRSGMLSLKSRTRTLFRQLKSPMRNGVWTEKVVVREFQVPARVSSVLSGRRIVTGGLSGCLLCQSVAKERAGDQVTCWPMFTGFGLSVTAGSWLVRLLFSRFCRRLPPRVSVPHR